MRTFLLVRHGQSLLNVAGVINGDPARDRGLSAQGIEQATQLAGQLAHLPIDLVVVSTFPARGADGRHRARRAGRAAGGRRRPRRRPDRRARGRVARRLPRSRSRTPTATSVSGRREPQRGGPPVRGRVRTALRAAEPTTLVVCHEIPVRYAVNAAGGSDELDATAARCRERDAVPVRRAGAPRAPPRGSPSLQVSFARRREHDDAVGGAAGRRARREHEALVAKHPHLPRPDDDGLPDAVERVRRPRSGRRCRSSRGGGTDAYASFGGRRSRPSSSCGSTGAARRRGRMRARRQVEPRDAEHRRRRGGGADDCQPRHQAATAKALRSERKDTRPPNLRRLRVRLDLLLRVLLRLDLDLGLDRSSSWRA